MSEVSPKPETEKQEELSSQEKYRESMARFDEALCEGCAVCQEISGITVHPSLGYSTHVFTRILSHGRNVMRSVPQSKWCSDDYEDWDFGANASSFRSILEASLLFHYLCDADPDVDNQRAIVQLMHLYDINKRATIIHGGKVGNDYDEKRTEIVDLLENTKRFKNLPNDVQNNALKGKILMLESKEEIMTRLGWDKNVFYFLWNLTSQYAHVYSLAFYRIEPNGRGTGMENDSDRDLLAVGLNTCALILAEITDALCNHFPDAMKVRNGVYSKFSPGPYRNLPSTKRRAMRKRKRGRK